MILVTGGSGYFGFELVSALARDGKAVRIFDLVEPDDLPEGVEVVLGDIRDAKAVQAAVTGCETILHNVAAVPLKKDSSLQWTVNRDGTRNLLQAAAKAKARRVVHMSSSAVFGIPKKNPVDDSVEPSPGEEYGRAKLAAERLCHEAAADGLEVTIIRPRTILGPGRLGIMQIVFEWVAQNADVPVLGGGDNLYQFVHADDLASATIAAAHAPAPQGKAAIYNIGAADICPMRDTLRGLIEHAGSKSRIVSLPASLGTAGMKLTTALGLSPLGAYHALMYSRSMYFDIERPRRELGWEPRYGNVQAFCAAYDWYMANRDAVLAGKGTSPHRSAVPPGVLKLASQLFRVLPAI